MKKVIHLKNLRRETNHIHACPWCIAVMESATMRRDETHP